jgi:hypothetical protein
MMVRWKRRSAQEVAVWRGGGLLAEPALIAPKAIPGVTLSTGDMRMVVPVDELWKFGQGERDVVEAIADTSGFLARARAAAPTSLAAAQLAGLPGDAIVLLPADPTRPPAVVLTAVTATEFTSWARSLMA